MQLAPCKCDCALPSQRWTVVACGLGPGNPATSCRTMGAPKTSSISCGGCLRVWCLRAHTQLRLDRLRRDVRCYLAKYSTVHSRSYPCAPSQNCHGIEGAYSIYNLTHSHVCTYTRLLFHAPNIRPVEWIFHFGPNLWFLLITRPWKAGIILLGEKHGTTRESTIVTEHDTPEARLCKYLQVPRYLHQETRPDEGACQTDFPSISGHKQWQDTDTTTNELPPPRGEIEKAEKIGVPTLLHSDVITINLNGQVQAVHVS